MCQDVMVEYMGFMTMSAVLKQAGHTVDVFFDDQLDEDRFIGQLRAFRPDAVLFSILSPSLSWSLRVGQRAKDECGAVTVYGNVHVIACPDMIENEAVDIVCTGEGEFPMLALCKALDEGTSYTGIDGLWVKTADGGVVKNKACDDLVDCDALPFHDREMYNKFGFFAHSPYLRVMAGRGCPFRCSFCMNPVLMDHFGGKRYLRKRCPEGAIQEIEDKIKNHPTKVKFLFFIDEVFWVKNDWLREFLALYKQRINLPFSANFRFGGITEDDIRLLAEAGAANMTLATESGDEGQRRGIMNKPVSNEQILKIAGWMHKYGISFVSSCFFGLPGDTVEDHVKRLDFFRKVNPTYLWTTFFQPYPGVDLTKHEDVARHMPDQKEFAVTLHHDMYLDLPDRDRLVNLKKVYFLCVKFPRLTPLLVALTKIKFDLLFTALFGLHFTYYIFRFERVSLYQFLTHVRNFAVNPFLRKKQTLAHTGRPYTPPTDTPGKPAVKKAPVAAAPARVGVNGASSSKLPVPSPNVLVQQELKQRAEMQNWLN
jgi:anaerobic magnesium-protoporphyrin IX monomethyl ester cyclase